MWLLLHRSAHGVHLFTGISTSNSDVLVPTLSSPAPTSGSPAPTSGSPAPISLIAGLTVGVVVGIAGVLTCITLFLVFMRQRKSSTSLEQPLYDYVAPSQPPTLPERINLEKNDAYGTHPQLTSVSPSLQSNVAYGVTERMQMEENDAYNILHSTIPPP